MQTIKIQAHTSNAIYEQPHFFIQSKGYNAGRPSPRAYNNSYVILVNDELEKGIIFWICYALWKANQFLPTLKGCSGILNIPLLRKLIAESCEKLSHDPNQFLTSVTELKELIRTEKLLSIQAKLIARIKSSIVQKMI